MKTLRRTALAVALIAGGCACSSSPSPNDSTGAAVEDAGALAEDGGLSTDETATLASGGDSLAAEQETATLADSLFDFDPTIDPTATPAANAASIGANVQSNLGAACGQVSVSGTTVSVSFGAAPGCTLAGGTQISGTVNLGVSEASGTTTIALTLTSVVVNGEALSGQASFATTNGSTFNVTSSMTSGAKVHASTLTIIGGSSSFSISGTATVTESGSTSNVTLTNVVHTKGECYATSGSMTVAKGGTSEVLTFEPSTPATGVVSVQIGKHTTTATLPAYGDCPSDAQDGGRGRD